MLPLSYKDKYSPKLTTRLHEKISSIIRLIYSDKNSRNLFLFLLINLSFAFVELMYGIWNNCLGLISDSFHMFFDCTGLLLGLAASIVTKWKPNERYSYGYLRAEVIAGFINGLVLICIAICIMYEAVFRFFEPPEVKHERLLVVSILGFVVNIVGIFVFQHGGQGHGSCSHGHGHTHSNNNHQEHGHGHGHGHGHEHGHSLNTNSVHISTGHSHGSQFDNHSHSHSHSHSNSIVMKGVFLHILADTLGSVGVIISAILMQTFGWSIADPVCSLFISILIAASVVSLIKDSSEILMQRQPKLLDPLLSQCYQKVVHLPGVFSVQEPHFWTLSSDYFVGALKLEVSKNIDPKYIVSHTQSIFASVGVKQLYVQLDYTIT